MLEYAVSTDGYGTVVDNGLPEEVGSFAPVVVLLNVGNALEAYYLGNLGVGVYAC